MLLLIASFLEIRFILGFHRSEKKFKYFILNLTNIFKKKNIKQKIKYTLNITL